MYSFYKQATLQIWRHLRCGILLGLCMCFLACGGNVSNNKFRVGHGGMDGYLFFADGSPAVGAQVRLVNLPLLNATTDKKGYFKIFNVPAGRREVLLAHGKRFASRIPVWVVHGYTLRLKKDKSIIQPVGQILGQISAHPRFDAKDILVRIKGLPYSTITRNTEGHFTLTQVPTGCHVLMASAPFFGMQEVSKVCVAAEQKKTIEEVVSLPPVTPCKTTGSACSKGGVCAEGFCVPDPGGTGQLLQQGVWSLGSLQLKQEKQIQRAVLYNAGPGRLTIRRATLLTINRAFTLKSEPTFPVVLEKGSSFAIALRFQALELGSHQAILELETDDKKKPIHRVVFKGEVTAYPSNCLTTNKNHLDLGVLKGDQPRVFTVDVSNRCDRTLLLQDRGPKTGREAVVCRHSWMGSFSSNVCLNLVQALPIKIERGRTVRLQFQLLPKSYGAIRGTLSIPHDETPTGSLDLSIQAQVQSPAVQVFPTTLNFGSVAPSAMRTLWLRVDVKEFITDSMLSTIRVKVNQAEPGVFEVLPQRIRRLSTQAKTLFLPLRVKTPVSGDALKGFISIEGLPGVQAPYVVPIQASLATQTEPFGASLIDLGAPSGTSGCVSRKEPIWVVNPSKQVVTVKNVLWSSPETRDFELSRAALPIRIEPGARQIVGWMQTTPSTQPIRRYGHVLVELESERSTRHLLTVGVQALSGLRMKETFAQSERVNVDILVYVDPSVQDSKDIDALHKQLATLLSELKKNTIHYRLLPMGHSSLREGISPFTPNPSSELKLLLKPAQSSFHQGFEVFRQFVSRYTTSKARNTVTLALFLSRQDDASPYDFSRYFQSTKATVFAMTPSSKCASGSRRYRSAVQKTQGYWGDICVSSSSEWTLWGQHLRRFVLGKQFSFPLLHAPNVQSIQLTTQSGPISRKLWSYKPEKRRIELVDAGLLPTGYTLDVTYFTVCQ